MSYHIRVVQEFFPDGKEAWFAEHPALLGCHAMGRTCLEATMELPKAREAWLRLAKQYEGTIPSEPEDSLVDVIFYKKDN